MSKKHKSPHPHNAAGTSEQQHHSHDHEHQHEHNEHEHSHDHQHKQGHAHDAHPPHHALMAADRGTVLTVRTASGLSGDMMLAGLATVAGLHTVDLQALIDELHQPALQDCLNLEERSVNHIAGVGCHVHLPQEHAHRNLSDILHIIEASAMPQEAQMLASKAFSILAEAEAAVHGKKAAEVTFHEVGALDSIVDMCLVCRIFTLLQPVKFICSPLPLADGVIHCAHGHVPCPAPAVLRLLEGLPVYPFPARGETVTPTALALLRALEADFGPWPTMRVRKTCISYGTKVWENAPNGAVWALGDM